MTYPEVLNSCKISYKTLIPTHGELRSRDSVVRWTKIYKSYDYAIMESNPILLNRTEDGLIYIHDGHHRLSAAYQLGIAIKKLSFKILDYTYEEMQEINFDCGWVTPFNPKTHVRTHCLHIFKPYILSLLKINKDLALEAIKQNFPIYAKPRKSNSIKDICESYV